MPHEKSPLPLSSSFWKLDDEMVVMSFRKHDGCNRRRGGGLFLECLSLWEKNSQKEGLQEQVHCSECQVTGGDTICLCGKHPKKKVEVVTCMGKKKK